jgi:beta-glucosidase
MQQLDLDAYRFSISWPRVLPEGSGSANQLGLDYYDRLVDTLLSYNIQPFPTLFHWDMPLALFKKMGGFADRRCTDLFADYCEIVVSRLGDRVNTG